MKKKYAVIAALLAVGAALAWWLWPAASPTYNRRVTRAMYHWRAQDLSAKELRYLDTLGITKVYWKFFDVEYTPGQGPQPYHLAGVSGYKSLTTWADTLGRELVPTVFITNACLAACTLPEAEELGRKIARKMRRHFGLKDILAWPDYVHECQIDCDWTAATRDKYFALLNAMRPKLGGRTLSVTLRLYPFKYRQACGVPPADRAMLMCYNLSPLRRADTENAIFSEEVAEAYLKDQLAYPLPLDGALPIFRWGVLVRDGRVIGLVNHADAREAVYNTYLKQDDPTHFTSLADTVFGGYFLRTGDKVRFDAVPEDALLGAGRLAAPLAAEGVASVALFNLDTALLKSYDLSTLHKAYAVFE